MDKSQLQEQAKLLLLSIKGEGAAEMPSIPDIASGGMMGLMANPKALIEAAKALQTRSTALLELAENLNARLCALEGENRE